MDFFDTQILLHKFSNNKNSLNKSLDADIEKQDITGGQISSVVALEFLSVMGKDCNHAKMYPVKLAINHPPLPTHYRFRRKGCEIGKHRTDKIVIDFNSEFDNIVIYSNEAISQLINRKDLDGLLFFARNTYCRKDYITFRNKVQFLIDNNLSVVPITQEIVNVMHHIYEEIKGEYNVKANYRNSFMDLLILATAVTYKRYLYTKDKELQKLVVRYCNYDSGIDAANGTAHIESSAIKNNGQDNKGFVNNKWRLIRS